MILKEKEVTWYEPKENQHIQDYGFCACLYISIKSVLFIKRNMPMSIHTTCSIFYI